MTHHGRAAVTDGAGSLSIEAIGIPPPTADHVVVRVGASGVCHTDFDSMRWGRRLLLGHEGAGAVVAVGDTVTAAAIGDRVLLTWSMPCGTCFQCTIGNEHLCERSSPVVGSDSAPEPERAFNLGTLATYTVVNQLALVAIPHNMPFTTACVFGCGVMTGYGSVINAAKVTNGSSAVVLGVGGVGLNVVQAARLAGANPIIAIDLREEHLERAKRFGATHGIIASADPTHSAGPVRDLTDGRGADYAFECTGVPELAALPLLLVRHGGTAVQVSGVEREITVDMEWFEWDKTYLNPLYGQCSPGRDFPAMFSLYERGQLLVDELITARYCLDDLPHAFEDMRAGRNAKGVIVFDD